MATTKKKQEPGSKFAGMVAPPLATAEAPRVATKARRRVVVNVFDAEGFRMQTADFLLTVGEGLQLNVTDGTVAAEVTGER